MDSKAYISTNQSQDAVIITARPTESRQLVHLIFVIDTSDSMDGERLDSVNQSIRFIAPHLTPQDLVSVITFGDNSEIILKQAPPTALMALNLKASGCTNMSAALLNVKDCMGTSLKEGVLLLTDGHANTGMYAVDGLKSIILSLGNLTVNTIGYGDDHNAELLRDIAISGGGSYNIVYRREDVATVFGEILGGLTTLVAQNVVVHLPPGTTVMTAYTTTTTSSNVLVRVGDIYSENEIVILCNMAPLSTTVRITGHVGMSSYDETIPFTQITSIPKNIEEASFRYRVSRLLISRPPQAEIEDLLAELKALVYCEEPLIKMMIDDLDKLLNRQTTNLLQHSAFLSLGRGLRSEDDPVTPDSHGASRASVLASPFSNRMQRRTTAALHNTMN